MENTTVDYKEEKRGLDCTYPKNEWPIFSIPENSGGREDGREEKIKALG